MDDKYRENNKDGVASDFSWDNKKNNNWVKNTFTIKNMIIVICLPFLLVISISFYLKSIELTERLISSQKYNKELLINKSNNTNDFGNRISGKWKFSNSSNQEYIVNFNLKKDAITAYYTNNDTVNNVYFYQNNDTILNGIVLKYYQNEIVDIGKMSIIYPKNRDVLKIFIGYNTNKFQIQDTITGIKTD